ncbi:MAG: hypothetical protein ACJ8GW_06425 [Massilia sp.]
MTDIAVEPRHLALRILIKALIAATIVLCVGAIAFPLDGGRWAWTGGLTASMAAMCALIISYREEEVVLTRGGPVYKKDSTVLFFINYLQVGMIIFAAIFVCTVGLLVSS